ncbi:MAG TPA: hypothetical protein VEK15_02955 [Vicinamibacteria bacterium]|nr:hypothetical protein [Vicinamibacteria bacterium]
MKSVASGALGGIGLALALAVRDTLRVPVLGDTTWLLSSLPGPGWLLLAALLGGMGMFLGRLRLERFVTPFVWAGLAGAIFVPGVFRAFPVLASLAGRFLDLVLVVVGLVALSRSRWVGSLRLQAKAVGVIGFVLYVVLGLKISHEVGLSGDEPHYLLVAYSVIHDGDLKVQNNYAAEDFRNFYRGKMGPHLAANTPYSVHGIGLPLLLLPGFALLGLSGVLLTEALLSAFLLYTVHRLALRLTGDSTAALIAAAGLGFTAPGAFLAVSAYPELPAAVVVALVTLRVTELEPPKPWTVWGFTFLVGSLLFLHVKFLLLALTLWGALGIRFRRTTLFLGALLCLGALVAFSFAMHGSLDPAASYGRRRVFLSAVPLGVSGLLLDQEFGLLPNSPFYLLGFAALAPLRRRHAFIARLTCLVLLSVMLPGAAHPLWSGGNSPPARFLFPALPLLAVFAGALVSSGGGLARWAPALLAISLALAGAMALLTPQPLFLNARDGTSAVYEALSSSWDLTDYLPSLVRADTASIVWSAVFLLFLGFGIAGWSERVIDRVPLPVLVLVLAGIQDTVLQSRRSTLAPVWASTVFHELARREHERFLALPSREKLHADDVMERVALPLEAIGRDGDPDHWWSRSYALPAGAFRVEGIGPEGATFANGEGIFSGGSVSFRTDVGLAQFRLRARTLLASPRVRLTEVQPNRPVALRSIALEDGSRLHGLDDNSYLDPAGFWVRKDREAAFVLEPAGDGGTFVVLNGPMENWVTISSRQGTMRFRLPPAGEKSVKLTKGVFSVATRAGFRPADFASSSNDQRELSVLLAARPAFDLRR